MPRPAKKEKKSDPPDKSPAAPPDYTLRLNPYAALADRIGLSERTVRKAFSRDPITWQTACRIAKHLQIDVYCFRCIEDNRGRKKP